MKFVFDRAVKGEQDGYNYSVYESFRGKGPFQILGKKFGTAEQWFDHAKRTALALGIENAECAIVPPQNGASATFLFTFERGADCRTFQIATKGNVPGSNRFNISCSSDEERASSITALIKFLQQNEIEATIETSSSGQISVLTEDQFSHCALVSAHENGKFTPLAPPLPRRAPDQP